MNCTSCGRTITSDLLTFGPIGEEVCENCWVYPTDEEGYEFGYGFFPGGDPRDFTPDYEMCSPEEIERWKADCALAESGNTVNVPPSGQWIFNDAGEPVMHILAPRYGMGTYRVKYDE